MKPWATALSIRASPQQLTDFCDYDKDMIPVADVAPLDRDGSFQ